MVSTESYGSGAFKYEFYFQMWSLLGEAMEEVTFWLLIIPTLAA